MSNIRALGAIHAAMIMEELKAFQVSDRLVELFEQGMLPVGREGATPRVRLLLSASEAFGKLPSPAQEQIARDTSRVADLVAKVEFPQFVAELIAGAFRAIVSASIDQMQAYAELVAAAAADVDEFLSDNVTEAELRDRLAQQLPKWRDWIYRVTAGHLRSSIASARHS